jgi:hypothetical protein
LGENVILKNGAIFMRRPPPFPQLPRRRV